jgi:predicted NACHT family NTPase
LLSDSTDWVFFIHRGPLINASDFYWLIECLRDTTAQSAQRIFVALITRTFDPRKPDQMDALLQACRLNHLLAHEFSWLLSPVTVGSPEAQAMKARWAELNDVDSEVRKRPVLDPPPEQRIYILLQKFDDGDLDAFWWLNRDLTLARDSTRYGNEGESDLALLPGWKHADLATRAKIVDAAKRYLDMYHPPAAASWIKTNSFPYSALAGLPPWISA